jgi:hypothetical protein
LAVAEQVLHGGADTLEPFENTVKKARPVFGQLHAA